MMYMTVMVYTLNKRKAVQDKASPLIKTISEKVKCEGVLGGGGDRVKDGPMSFSHDTTGMFPSLSFHHFLSLSHSLSLTPSSSPFNRKRKRTRKKRKRRRRKRWKTITNSLDAAAGLHHDNPCPPSLHLPFYLPLVGAGYVRWRFVRELARGTKSATRGQSQRNQTTRACLHPCRHCRACACVCHCNHW